MSQFEALPRDLRIVAFIFLLGGIDSALSMIIGAMTNHPRLEFGVISIFAFFGLLRLSNGWRIYALVMTWLAIIFFPVLAIVALTTNHFTFSIFNVPVTQIPTFAGILLAIFFLLLALWQLKVLTRPDVEALFQK